MRDRRTMVWGCGPAHAVAPYSVFGLVSFLLLAPAAPPAAAQPKAGAEAGRSASADGAILRREAAGKGWRPVRTREPLAAGEHLVSFRQGALDSQNGGVRLSLLGELDPEAPSPILESAVTLRENPQVDLDFTLDRGRVKITNRKEKGEALVRVHFRNQVWELALPEPGTEVALELFGRWPRGVHFTKSPKPGQGPTSDLVMVVLHGHVDLRTGTRQFALSAPPGPAYFHWDSVVGADSGPERLDRLPGWADKNAPLSARAKELHRLLDPLRARLLEVSGDQVLAEALASKNIEVRKLAVYSLAALGELNRLGDVLADRQQPPEVREAAIQALRHYLGSDPAHDVKFYHLLVDEKKMSPAHAEIIADLLHTPGEADIGRPELYETLIEYLKHERLGIRELAKWHLNRLVPAGRTIKYDPAGPPEERERAYQQWKKLIPDGKLPPKAK
jgi:hypothetical protein